MAVQTSYSINMAAALPGLLAGVGPYFTASFLNADVVNIDFGLAVVRGTNDNEAVLPTASNQEFLGVTIRELTRENLAVGSSQTAYLPGEMMNINRQSGTIYVAVEVNVAAGDPVYYRFSANGGFTTLGAFRNDADVSGSAHAVLVPNAKFDKTASAGGISVIIFNAS